MVEERLRDALRADPFRVTKIWQAVYPQFRDQIGARAVATQAELEHAIIPHPDVRDERTFRKGLAQLHRRGLLHLKEVRAEGRTKNQATIVSMAPQVPNPLWLQYNPDAEVGLHRAIPYPGFDGIWRLNARPDRHTTKRYILPVSRPYPGAYAWGRGFLFLLRAGAVSDPETMVSDLSQATLRSMLAHAWEYARFPRNVVGLAVAAWLRPSHTYRRLAAARSVDALLERNPSGLVHYARDALLALEHALGRGPVEAGPRQICLTQLGSRIEAQLKSRLGRQPGRFSQELNAGDMDETFFACEAQVRSLLRKSELAWWGPDPELAEVRRMTHPPDGGNNREDATVLDALGGEDPATAAPAMASVSE